MVVCVASGLLTGMKRGWKSVSTGMKRGSVFAFLVPLILFESGFSILMTLILRFLLLSFGGVGDDFLIGLDERGRAGGEFFERACLRGVVRAS